MNKLLVRFGLAGLSLVGVSLVLYLAYVLPQLAGIPIIENYRYQVEERMKKTGWRLSTRGWLIERNTIWYSDRIRVARHSNGLYTYGMHGVVISWEENLKKFRMLWGPKNNEIEVSVPIADDGRILVYRKGAFSNGTVIWPVVTVPSWQSKTYLCAGEVVYIEWLSDVPPDKEISTLKLKDRWSVQAVELYVVSRPVDCS